MPHLDGIGAMRELRRRASPSRVIVLTSFLDDERLMPALQAGAAGYLLKDVEPAELARAVRSACADEALIDPTVAARLLHTLSRDGNRGAVGMQRHGHDRAAHPPRARGPGAHRARPLQQADRAGARRRGEDGQDPRGPPAGQARRRRPHPGRAAGRADEVWAGWGGWGLGLRTNYRYKPGPLPTYRRWHVHSHHHRSLPRPRPGARQGAGGPRMDARHRRPRRSRAPAGRH